MSDARPWRATADGLVLRVHLTPRSSRDGIDGIEQRTDEPMIKARVRAVPEDGKANAALETLIAEWLGVPKRAVSVVAGLTSRTKTIAIAGAAATLDAALASKLEVVP